MPTPISELMNNSGNLTFSILAQEYEERSKISSCELCKLYDFLWLIHIIRGDLNEMAKSIYGIFFAAEEINLTIKNGVCHFDNALQSRNRIDPPNHADWLTLIENNLNTPYELYSIVHLYIAIFDFSSDFLQSHRNDFLGQLRAAQNARKCLAANPPLIAPNKNLDDLIKIFAYLYCFIDHFGANTFDSFLDKLCGNIYNDLETKDNLEFKEEISRLLRYWGAVDDTQNTFFRNFLENKLDFKFQSAFTPQPVEIPAHHGLDNYIYLIGPKQVGKTHFLFASEEDKSLGLKILDEDLDNLSETKKEIDRLRDLWVKTKAGYSHDDLANDFSTKRSGLPTLYAQTKVENLCRFIFYDIAGEELYQPSQNSIPRNDVSLDFKDYFLRRYPSALLLIFDLNNVQTKAYEHVVKLMEGHLESLKKTPIYLVMNKADIKIQLYKNQTGIDQNLIDDLDKLLKNSKAWCDKLNFLNFQSFNLDACEQLDTNAILKTIKQSEIPCSNLAFLDILLKNIGEAGPLIEQLCNEGFKNLSVLYTSCVFDSDQYDRGISALWNHVKWYISNSTKQSRKKHFKDNFILQINKDFKTVICFVNNLDKISEFIIDQNQSKLHQDLSKLHQSLNAGNNLGLKEIHAIRETELTKKTISCWKKKFSDQINESIDLVLKELGIPIDNHANSLKTNIALIENKDLKSINENDKVKKAKYFYKHGPLKTLCSFTDEINQEVTELLNSRGSTKIIAVIKEITDPANRKKLCKSLKNYTLKYSQFGFKEILEGGDIYKFFAVNDEEIKKIREGLEEILLEIFDNLMKIYDELDHSITEGSILNCYFSTQADRYFYNLLQKYIPNDNRLKFENLKKIQEELKKRQGKLYSLNWKWLRSGTRLLRIWTISGDSIKEKWKNLKVVEKDQEELDLLSPLINEKNLDFINIKIGEIKTNLKKYKKERKLLILRERVFYLDKTEWLSSVLNENQIRIKGYALSPPIEKDPEIMKTEIINNVLDKIFKDDGAWGV